MTSSTVEETVRLVEPYTDLGNLLLLDTEPIEAADNLSAERLGALTRRNAQHLFDAIWKLPRKIVEDATCAQLPECNYALPREKPVPKPKEPTKWERFAKEKGIAKKTNRSKKVWDDTSQDWKPRYGYRRATNDGPDGKKDWLIEIPDQKDPYADYFEEKSTARQEQRSKQELQRLRNVAARQQNAAQLPQPQQTVQAQQNNAEWSGRNGRNAGRGRPQKQFSGANATPLPQKRQLAMVPDAQKSKEQLIHQVHRAKAATASVGKFQQTMKGEVKPKNTGERRKFDPNEGKENLVSERERQMKILEGLQAKKPKLAENRVNAVGEHIRRTAANDGDEPPRGGGGAKRRSSGGGPARRPKSQIDRQQKFRSFKKQSAKRGGSAGAGGGGKRAPAARKGGALSKGGGKRR